MFVSRDRGRDSMRVSVRELFVQASDLPLMVVFFRNVAMFLIGIVTGPTFVCPCSTTFLDASDSGGHSCDLLFALADIPSMVKLEFTSGISKVFHLREKNALLGYDF